MHVHFVVRTLNKDFKMMNGDYTMQFVLYSILKTLVAFIKILNLTFMLLVPRQSSRPRIASATGRFNLHDILYKLSLKIY